VKGNLLAALGHVVPSHLLDKDLARAVAATGEDPWLDEEDDSECDPEPGVVALPRPRG
jgi:tRNA 2-thiocytidine biosynthesis protein TtcA